MTEREHADLSRRLALALGWCTVAGKLEEVEVHGPKMHGFRRFDYRDPTVWGPVLEWLQNRHDVQTIRYGDVSQVWISGRGAIGVGNTLPEAVALAVIAVREET